MLPGLKLGLLPQESQQRALLNSRTGHGPGPPRTVRGPRDGEGTVPATTHPGTGTGAPRTGGRDIVPVRPSHAHTLHGPAGLWFTDSKAQSKCLYDVQVLLQSVVYSSLCKKEENSEQFTTGQVKCVYFEDRSKPFRKMKRARALGMI